MFELEKSTNVAQLMAIVEDGLGRSSGQDGTILAVRRLGELGDARAMPLLLRALDHTNVQVQTGAALSIYQLGDNYGLNQLIAWLSEESFMGHSCAWKDKRCKSN